MKVIGTTRFRRWVLYVGVWMIFGTGITDSIREVRANSSDRTAIRVGHLHRAMRCPVCSSDLVVRGIVNRVEEQHILVEEWYGEIPQWMERMRPLPPGAGIDAFRVHVTVEEVLFGKSGGAVFEFGVDREDRGLCSAGDTIIVALRYLRERLGGSYWLRDDALLIRRGDVWVCQVGTGEFTLEEIQEMLWEETDVRHFTKEADVVAVVEMIGPARRDIEAERLENTEQIRRVPTKVVRVMKGIVLGDTLSFVVGGLRTATDWWQQRHVPRYDYAERQVAGWNGRWLLFLKRGPVGLYPMGGANGMLKIQGDKLLLNNRVEHPYTFKAIETLVSEEVGP
jgi:hypothetical protein